MATSAIEQLSQSFTGQLLQSGSAGYDEARWKSWVAKP